MRKIRHAPLFATVPAAAGLFAGTCLANSDPDRPLALDIAPEAIIEAMPLAADGLDLFSRATAKERAHAEDLKRRGIAELPPEEDDWYIVDTGGLGDFVFDGRGELSLDRRFLSAQDLKTIRRIEEWIAKWFPRETRSRAIPRLHAGFAGLPVFRGFESARYQQHDALISALVRAFNADKAGWSGGTTNQAAHIPDLRPALVKAHMIEESGGRSRRSRAAWETDPLQVNVPGDWGEEKTLVGLARPERRNEGTAEQNVRAAIKYLVRKGFGVSARPAAERAHGVFDGWKRALQRYNGRRDRTDTDRYYSDEYADKILRRANNPDLFVPIEIKLAATAAMER